MKRSLSDIARFFQMDVPQEQGRIKDNDRGCRNDSYSILRQAVIDGGVRCYMVDGSKPYASDLVSAGFLVIQSPGFYLPTQKSRELIKIIEG